MTIPEAEWRGFIERLRRIDDAASKAITEYVAKNPGIYNAVTGTFQLTDDVIAYAYAVATKYGEASAALAAEMYDELAMAQNASVPPAVPAKTATYGEVARALYGTFNDSQRVDVTGATTGRLVKQAGFDTTVQNAKRDGAQIAFVPHGDTCAFCLVKGSRGWDKAGSWAQNMDGHAAHCHAHCDCTYAVRFDKRSNVAGYDPQKLRKMYDAAAPGGSSKEKINALRRKQREENKEEINEQKRKASAARNLQKALENAGAYSSNDYHSVYEEYLKAAKTDEGGFSADLERNFKNREEHNLRMLQRELGGNLVALREGFDPNEHYPDFEWNGRLWEEQEPLKHTKNAVDQNIREAIHQISKNPGGIVLDIGNSDMPMEEVHQIINGRLRRSAPFSCDVAIIRNGKIIDICRYQK